MGLKGDLRAFQEDRALRINSTAGRGNFSPLLFVLLQKAEKLANGCWLIFFQGKRKGPWPCALRIRLSGTPIEGRPADQFNPQLRELRREAEQMGILKKEEDLITYALYPNTAPKFLKGKMNEESLPAEGRDT
jgi:hypothetical protein